MALKRKYGYVEGNTVRKITPVERPERRQRPQRQVHRHVKQESVRYVNIFYAIFIMAAACMVLWSCINYLQLHAEKTSRVKNIAALEVQLEELKKENDDNYTRIITAVDLDYVKDIAINELGMVYANSDQVILYDGGTKDYVRQNGEIPKKESSLVDQILRK